MGNSAMTFDDLEELVIVAGGAGSIAELHGTLCGCISGGRALDSARLRRIAADVLALTADAVANLPLQQLYRDAELGLQSENCDFAPLLPEDDAPLALRVEALAGWCQGYLSGLGQSGLAGGTRLSADVSAAMRDMAAIALADAQTPDSNQSEADFIELVEYVRVAAMLIFAEVAAAAKPTRHSVH